MPDLTPEQVADFNRRFKLTLQPDNTATIRSAAAGSAPIPAGKDFVNFRDFTEAFETIAPGPVERLVTAIGEGLVAVKEGIVGFGERSLNVTDVVGRSVRQFGTSGLIPPLPEDLAKLPESEQARLREQFAVPSPEEVRAATTASLIDVAAQSVGFGLGRFASGPLLRLVTSSKGAQQFAAKTFQRGVQGAAAGLSPLFADPKNPEDIKARLETAAIFASISAVAEPAVIGLARTGARSKLAQKLGSELEKGLDKLGPAQLLRNTLPRVVEKLAITADIFKKVGDDITRRAGETVTKLEAERVGLGLGKLNPGLRQIALNKAYKKETAAVAGELKGVLVDELKLVGTVLNKLLLKRGQVRGKLRTFLKASTLNGLKADTNRLLNAIQKGQLKAGSLNQIEGMSRGIDEFARQMANALPELVGPSPLQVLQRVFAKGVPAGERGRAAVTSVRNSLFGWFSFVQDSIGNFTQVGTDLASRGVADLTDVMMGRAVSAGRLSAVVNSVRNHALVSKWVDKQFKVLFAAGEVVGGRGGLGPGATALEKLLFGPLELKGLSDRIARRYMARVLLFDEAYNAARKAGATGLERELFVRNFLRGGIRGELPGLVQQRVITKANRAAFIVPRGPRFTEFVDRTWVQLTISPFIRFGRAWAEFVGEFVPIAGIPITARRVISQGGLPVDAISNIIVKQLTGAGAIHFYNKSIYDHLTFTPFGIRYTDPDSGTEAILNSPEADIVAIAALMRGDFDKFMASLNSSGLTFLGGGLLGRLPLTLISPGETTKKKLAFELDRVVGNMFPGRATLRLLNDTFTRFREEPLTEGGSFLPGATTLPGLTGRPRIREGGVGESTFRRIKGSIVGDMELLVPSSFGTIITERELTEVEKFLVFARRKTGRKFEMLTYPTGLQLRTQGGMGVVTAEPDEQVRRYFIVKKNQMFADLVAGKENDAFLKVMPPQRLSQWVDYYLGFASDFAKRSTERRFASTLSVTGEQRQ